jgi:(1->4)-alpha-D-glucan 1-alpha-D-glucosylmutase
MAPRATYRLQFNRDFTLRAALALVPYLAELGISHVYASPIMEARPGSTHGYDIVDHNRLNPEIGSDADFHALVAVLHDQGMGLILDIVPNHMGVGGHDNAWWLDVLEWGQASPYASYFDINWEAARPDLRGARHAGGRRIRAAELFEAFPVAVLLRT